MKKVSLSGSARKNVGKKDAKAVRNENMVPCVVYGGKDQKHFKVKHTDMEKLVFTSDVHMINLDIDGEKTEAIIQDIQQHPVTGRFVHVDFLQLFADKEIKMKIPVKVVGRSPGVLAGGKMQQVFRQLKVQGLPSAIPGEIEVDISTIKIGQAVRVKQCAKEGFTILDPANAVVVSVKMARGASKQELADEEADAQTAADSAADSEAGEAAAE